MLIEIIVPALNFKIVFESVCKIPQRNSLFTAEVRNYITVVQCATITTMSSFHSSKYGIDDVEKCSTTSTTELVEHNLKCILTFLKIENLCQSALSYFFFDSM